MSEKSVFYGICKYKKRNPSKNNPAKKLILSSANTLNIRFFKYKFLQG